MTNKLIEELEERFYGKADDLIIGQGWEEKEKWFIDLISKVREEERDRILGKLRKPRSKENELLKRDNKVLSIIKNYYEETGEYPSFRTLARIYGCTTRNVEVSVKKLRKLGYLENTSKISLSTNKTKE